MAEQLIKVVNDVSFRSLQGKSKHDLWMELCDVITGHPEEMGTYSSSCSAPHSPTHPPRVQDKFRVSPGVLTRTPNVPRQGAA